MELLALVGSPSSRARHGECFVWSRGTQEGNVVVDAGGTKGVGVQAAEYNPEVLVLTHDDHDHIGGAVELIKKAKGSLKELWVPADWGLLIKQIASSEANEPSPSESMPVDLDEITRSIEAQFLELANGQRQEEPNNGMHLLLGTLQQVKERLDAWNRIDMPDDVFAIEIGPACSFYGAKSFRDIKRRVEHRVGVLHAILTEAVNNSMVVRFFSIDLALSRSSEEEAWEAAGRKGLATIANAAEVPYATLKALPSGVVYTFLLTHITVQNRRALSTLLWTNKGEPSEAIVIWSDTDGGWLDALGPRGFSQVVKMLSLSSAPHHASANAAHNRVWQELEKAPATMVMISAGGHGKQKYHGDYKALASRRCCTWCRPSLQGAQEVSATFTTGKIFKLRNSCLALHP